MVASPHKRVYVGNLRSSSDLEESLRALFERSAISINNIRIVRPKRNQSSCFALIECDIGLAIRCLNGIQFQGKTLIVQAERKQNNNGSSMGGNNNNQRGGGSSFGGGWVKPKHVHKTNQKSSKSTTKKSTTASTANDETHDNNIDINVTSSLDTNTANEESSKNSGDDLTDLISNFVSSEINECSGQNDALTTAIASCAAVTAILSANLDEDESHNNADSDNEVKELSSSQPNGNDIDTQSSSIDKMDDIPSFQSKCNIPLSQLMKDYGEEDKDFDKMVVQTTAVEKKSSNQHQLESTTNAESKKNHVPNANTENGMLAANGKAPINIELVSFGHKYGVPREAKEGWSHSHPLEVFDCRDLPRAPYHVSRLSGLSHQVKRTMLKECNVVITKHSDEEESSETKSSEPTETNQLLSKSNIISSNIMDAIEDAIAFGHGYSFPLESTVYIGSEYGRRRSVVLCEILGQNV